MGGWKNLRRIKIIFRDYKFSLHNYSFVMRSQYVLNCTVEGYTLVVNGGLRPANGGIVTNVSLYGVGTATALGKYWVLC